MSSLRTHDDTWDIATSVGTTAVMVAAARAAETATRRPADPRPLRQASWSPAPAPGHVGRACSTSGRRQGGRHRRRSRRRSSSTCATTRRCARTSSTRTSPRPLAAGIRQMVILASGLDSRAYRLDVAGRHHRLRDRPAQGARVQGRDAGRQRCAAARPTAARCPSTCARTGRPRCATRASTRRRRPRGWPRGC